MKVDDARRRVEGDTDTSIELKTVPRIGRVLDLAGLLLFLGGGAVAAWAWIGFRDLPGSLPPPDAGAWAAAAVADGYWRLQKIGTGVMIAGLAVFVLAWWVARRVRSGASIE
jgi:hypothetical protein